MGYNVVPADGIALASAQSLMPSQDVFVGLDQNIESHAPETADAKINYLRTEDHTLRDVSYMLPT